MSGNRLRPFEADRLREAELTYAEVGATLGDLPPGYHHLDERFVIGQGRAVFDDASAELLRWGLQRRSGLAVASSADQVETGGVAVVRIRFGPLFMRAPVRVVAVVDERDRQGFVYGTLPGHPECGEELFVVEQDDVGVVRLRVRAFSKPGSLPARVLGPVGRVLQRQVTRRYGRALRR
ncbi:MAG: hypothetical protein JWR52_1427 [Marmoricola sp.]|nr:hypothetical protein [Marmoricola sp.]